MSAKEFTVEELNGELRLSADEHARVVAKRHGISVKDLLGHRRHPHLARARVELYRALREQGWSLPAIGGFCNRDHTSILYALMPKEKKLAKAAAQKARDAR